MRSYETSRPKANNRMRYFGICIIINICCLVNIASSGLPSETAIIIGKGTRGPYKIGFSNLITNSAKIFRDSVLFDSSSYSIGYVDGIIWFEEPITVGDTLDVEFRRLPISLQKNYFLHDMHAKSDRTESIPTTKENKPYAYSSDITITGSKGFSIESGNGGNGLSQSLNLNINGELVPGLRTSAHISDNSANGNTVVRKLRELDKIYIEAESKKFKGIFGDFDLIGADSELLNFQRKLTGLNARYNEDAWSFKGTAAFFPGEYQKIDIAGIDGRLGPYYLKDNNGREGILILPGSERVYIDGVLLMRGSEKDYSIDYESGTIEFSPSIIIRNESRITIEYEISREEYSRSFYAVGGATQPDNGFGFFAKFIQEGDNGNSPRNFEMTGENRGLLENAGADKMTASKSGVIFRGSGEGNYAILTDSLGNQYYQYEGQDLGEYDVTFSFVGESLGSYRLLGGGIFEYVGTGLGEYEPIILLPIPETKRYGSISSSWSSEDGEFNFRSELAGSSYDRNTISSSDKIQQGLSGTAKLDYMNIVSGSDAFYGADIKFRNIGKGSIFPGRIDEIERYRNYDLIPGSNPDGENLGEFNIKGGLSENRKISAMMGILTRPGIVGRKQNRGDISWKIVGPLAFNGKLERTSGDRIWWKRAGELSASFSKIQPGVTIEYEKREGQSGFKYYEYGGKLPAAYSSNINGTTEIRYRDEKTFDSGWIDKFRSGSITQKIELSAGKSGFSGELNGSYYKKKYRDYSGVDSDQKSGWTRLAYNDPKEKFDFRIFEKLSSSNERLRARNYILVGEGNGEYRLEDGEYIKDPEGDYVLLFEELGQGEKVTEISTEVFSTINPLKFSRQSERIEAAIGRIIIETELAYGQKKNVDRILFEDFVPWKKDNFSDLIFRNGRLDFRLFYYPPYPKQRVKYNAVRSYQDGQQYANETSRDDFSSDELSWAFPVSRDIDFVLTGLISTRNRLLNQTEYNLKRSKGSLSSEYKFAGFWILRIEGALENVNQADRNIKSIIPSAKTGLTRNFGKKGRITASLGYFRLTVNPKGSYVPYQVANGKREGDNIEGSLRARMELVKNGRLDISYRYENFAKRPVRQNLRLEFTLLFL